MYRYFHDSKTYSTPLPLPLYGYAHSPPTTPQTRPEQVQSSPVKPSQENNHLTTQLPHFLQSHLPIFTHTTYTPSQLQTAIPLPSTKNSHLLSARLLHSHGTISISYSTCIILCSSIRPRYARPALYSKSIPLRPLGTHPLRLTQKALALTPKPAHLPQPPNKPIPSTSRRSNAVDINQLSDQKTETPRPDSHFFPARPRPGR